MGVVQTCRDRHAESSDAEARIEALRKLVKEMTEGQLSARHIALISRTVWMSDLCATECMKGPFHSTAFSGTLFS